MRPTTEVLFSIYLVIGIVCALAGLIGIAYAVFKIRGLVRQVDARINNILRQVEEAVTRVSGSAKRAADQLERAAHSISAQAESIASTARSTANHVASRIETTADLIRDTVVTPVIRLDAILAGVRRASELLRERWTRRTED